MLNCKITKLPNNLTVVTDPITTVKSATVGIWSNIGSRIEKIETGGICHFLEHMVFKGTKNRTSFDISEQIENKGGYINAWTSKEKTSWYAKVLKDDVNLAFDILLDIVRNSTFPAEELEKEKGVILEEIKMYQDDPQDVVYNLYEKICYAGHPISYPIIGNEETIKSFSSKDFFSHLQHYYYPSNMVVVISGNFNENEFLQIVKEKTSDWIDKKTCIDLGNPVFKSAKELIIKKEVEQTSLVYALPGSSYKSANYYSMSIATTILGGGMSSRLFKEIREKRGLAYSIGSFLNTYTDCGSFAVHAGCSRENISLVINLIRAEIEQLAISFEDIELERAKNILKSSIVMSLESTSARCERIAGSILNFGELRDINHIIKKIDSVTKEDVLHLFSSLANEKESIALLSNSIVAGF